MKLVSWKRKLAASLVAAGLLSPAAIAQCTINTNLVSNPSFEMVDTADTGPFTSVRISSGWLDAAGDGDDDYAYPYSSGYSGDPAPPGSGDWHYTGGFATTPGEVQVTQTIDVSTGSCAAEISGGSASYDLSAWFSTYREQDDFSTVRARFLDSGGSEVGTVDIGGAAFLDALPVTGNQTDWGQDVGVGIIPSSTQSVEIQVLSEAGGANHDGYLDLVNFQVSDTLTLPALDISVDRDSGSIVLQNQTGVAVNLSGYSITSGIQAVDPSDATWSSIADNYDADSGGSVDATNVWSELSPPDAFSDLSEGDLSSGLGTTLAAGQSVTLSPGDGWIANPTEDLAFQYISNLEVETGFVTFVGNEGSAFAVGDFDTDGDIDADDWMILRGSQHADLSNERELAAYFQGDLNGDLQNNHTDFVIFASLYDDANGTGSFQDMLENIPEPGGMPLSLAAIGFSFGFWRRRKTSSSSASTEKRGGTR